MGLTWPNWQPVKMTYSAAFKPLGIRDFRLLWGGSFISMVGDQLTLIAYPWLVLKLTGDPLAMGMVLALAGIPRALFMVVGGVVTDRFSPRAVMILSNLGRVALLLPLSWVVYHEVVSLWVIYLSALVFGLVDAFFWPASSAIVPRLVPKLQLPAGNALMQGTGQLSVMLGPFAAGALIAAFSTTKAGVTSDFVGIAVVFAIDAACFVLSIISLYMIDDSVGTESGEASLSKTSVSVWSSLREGLGVVWQDLPLRIAVIVFALFTLFHRGAYLVGIPVLCDLRFDGAFDFGAIGAAWGTGALAGTLLAGSLPALNERWLGGLVLVDALALGGGLITYAVTPSINWVLAVTAITGMVDGYLIIVVISWLQLRIPIRMLGRVMSIVIFFNVGLAPVSSAIAGSLIKWSLEGVFLIAGLMLVTLSVIGMLVPVIRRFGMVEAPVKIVNSGGKHGIRL